MTNSRRSRFLALLSGLLITAVSEVPAASVFVATDSGLIRSNWSGGTQVVVQPSINGGFGLDTINKKIYFDSYGPHFGQGFSNRFQRSNVDGSASEVLIWDFAASTYAFDPVGRRVFLTRGIDLLEFSLDTLSLTPSLLGLNTIYDMEFVQSSGQLFVVNVLQSDESYDGIWAMEPGNFPPSSLVGGAGRLRGVAIDLKHERLIFTGQDSATHDRRVIFASDLDGSDRRVLIDTSMLDPLGYSLPYDVDVVEELGKIVWSDERLNGVFAADLDGSNVVKLFDAIRPRQLIVYVPEPTCLVHFAAFIVLWAYFCNGFGRSPTVARQYLMGFTSLPAPKINVPAQMV